MPRARQSCCSARHVRPGIHLAADPRLRPCACAALCHRGSYRSRPLLHVRQRYWAPSMRTVQAAHDGVRKTAFHCSVCEPKPLASAHSSPAPVLDRTPVGAGAGHMRLPAFPTHILLGADRRAQGICSSAGRRLPEGAVLSSSSARAVRLSCAGADACSQSTACSVFVCGRVRLRVRVRRGTWR